MPPASPPAARRWAAALAGWAVPEAVLAAAPEPPWGFTPSLFTFTPPDPTDPGRSSRRRALEALPAGGSVLDVGAGGGAAGLALAPRAGLVTGVDQGADMLAQFSATASELGVAHRAVQGSWPEAAGLVDPADVVVCHHVLYNVADLVPFVTALTDSARRRVVVELTDGHPLEPLNPLWRSFHGLDRPSGPSADDAAEVLAGLGLEVGRDEDDVAWWGPGPPSAERVAFTRKRLCVGPERDAEIAAHLAAGKARRVVTLWWEGRAPGGRPPG